MFKCDCCGNSLNVFQWVLYKLRKLCNNIYCSYLYREILKEEKNGTLVRVVDDKKYGDGELPF